MTLFHQHYLMCNKCNTSMHISSCVLIIFPHGPNKKSSRQPPFCSHQVTCKWKSCAGQASPVCAKKSEGSQSATWPAAGHSNFKARNSLRTQNWVSSIQFSRQKYNPRPTHPCFTCNAPPVHRCCERKGTSPHNDSGLTNKHNNTGSGAQYIYIYIIILYYYFVLYCMAQSEGSSIKCGRKWGFGRGLTPHALCQVDNALTLSRTKIDWKMWKSPK